MSVRARGYAWIVFDEGKELVQEGGTALQILNLGFLVFKTVAYLNQLQKFKILSAASFTISRFYSLFSLYMALSRHFRSSESGWHRNWYISSLERSEAMMLTQTSPNLPIETINWGKLSPTYPYRFNGPAYLYCVGCVHFIRMIQFSNEGVTCSECKRVLAISMH